MKEESKAKKIRAFTPDIRQTELFDIKELAKTIERTLGPVIQEQKRLNEMFAEKQPAIQKMINQANQTLKASGYPETVRQMNEARKQIERSMLPLKKLILPVIRQDYLVAPIRIMPPPTKETYSIQHERPQYDEKTIEKLIDKAVKEQIESRFSIIGVPKKISTIRLSIGNPVWNHVKISLQENACVRIYYKNNLVFQGDYESMGLYKKTRRGTEPSLEWRFLQKLSIFSGNFKGIKNKGLDINECRRTFSGASDASIHAIKSRLTKKLKVTMGIIDDPFYSYKEKGHYAPIFTIEPEPDLRSDRDLHLSGKPLPKNV